MKPFDIQAIHNVAPDLLAETREPDPMYIDWAFYNWGDTTPPELEPLKATLSMDVQEKTLYVTVVAVDQHGNDIDMPEGAYPWAAQQVKDLVGELLQFEGVHMNDRLQKLLEGDK